MEYKTFYVIISICNNAWGKLCSQTVWYFPMSDSIDNTTGVWGDYSYYHGAADRGRNCQKVAKYRKVTG